MIKHIDCYTIACDQCGKTFSTEEYIGWPDVSIAEMEAEDWDWEQIDNKHVCPGCYERDADGELILKVKEETKRPPCSAYQSHQPRALKSAARANIDIRLNIEAGEGFSIAKSSVATEPTTV